MLRYRWAVVAAWGLAVVVGAVAWGQLAGLLTNRFVLPGTGTERTEEVLRERFGQTSEGTFLLVARAEDGGVRRLLPGLAQAAKRAAEAVPTGRVAYVQPVAADVASAAIVTRLEPAEAKGYTTPVRGAVRQVSGADVYVTGGAALAHDLDPVLADDLKVGELFIAIPIALAILIFVFGTLAFLLPFVFALAAIPATLALVWGFANVMELSTYVPNMVMLVGLGIAVDYSLLVVYRYRDERRAGRSREEALVRPLATAGRAVGFSGPAVGMGLAVMLTMPLPFMRGFGVAGLAIPLVSVACAVTLLPVLVHLLGDRLDRVRLVPRPIVERRAAEENFWVRLSRAIMGRPFVFAGASIALLLALAAPVLSLQLTPGSTKGIPQDLESVRGMNALAAGVGEGALSPTEIVVDTGRQGGAESAPVQAAVARLARRLEGDPEVAAVRTGSGPQLVDAERRYVGLQVTGRHEYGEQESQAFARRLRSEIVPAVAFPAGVEVVNGGPPSGVDFLDLTYAAFPWMVAAVLLLTYVLLVRAFRSLLLPLKAIVLNLLSIGAAYGLLVAAFQWGGGEAFGLTGFDAVEGWIPVFMFAMLFGLSMDYEVFLVTRMREEWDARRGGAGHRSGADAANEGAVALGLAKTGRIVTAAGLIMFAAFMGFVAGSVVGLQQFGQGHAAAILIDVTLVRALLLPSVMKLFGRWNWWLPENVARLIRVEPSPARLTAPATAGGER